MHEKVVAFSVEVFTLVELTQLTDQTDKEKVKAAIDTTLASDGTDFSVALEETQSLIEKGTTDSESRFVVFMSDGQAMYPDTKLPLVIVTYTILKCQKFVLTMFELHIALQSAGNTPNLLTYHMISNIKICPDRRRFVFIKTPRKNRQPPQATAWSAR